MSRFITACAGGLSEEDFEPCGLTSLRASLYLYRG
jgi:hypothetical protein